VSYPKIFFNSLSHFNNLILEYDFDNIQKYLARYPSYQNLTSKETSIIILDFINNLDIKDYGIAPEKLGIKKGILID